MRAIKFRGKSKDKQLWEYGNLLHKRRTNSKATEIYESYYIQRVNFHLELEVIPETIGQFIGFYDKHGKEIYEGDVLKFNFIEEILKPRVTIDENGEEDKWYDTYCELKEFIGKVVFNAGAFQVAFEYDKYHFNYFDREITKKRDTKLLHFKEYNIANEIESILMYSQFDTNFHITKEYRNLYEEFRTLDFKFHQVKNGYIKEDLTKEEKKRLKELYYNILPKMLEDCIKDNLGFEIIGNIYENPELLEK